MQNNFISSETIREISVCEPSILVRRVARPALLESRGAQIKGAGEQEICSCFA